MTFQELNLHPTLLNTVKKEGYSEATDIQAIAIPHLLAGKDMIASAQTGTGKTAAFALPIIEHIQRAKKMQKERHPQALILAPTRELALQIKESFDTYSRMYPVRSVVVYGGIAKRNQIVKIKRGVDVLIATPGRLLDLYRMKILNFQAIKHVVLDEADQMLDMGFIEDVDTILSYTPKTRQTMLFSATIPPAIEALSKRILNNPIRIEITPQNTPLDTIDQSVYFVRTSDKRQLLVDILSKEKVTSALIFVRTKQGCNHLAKYLTDAKLSVQALHGDKTQVQRQKVLGQFKRHEIQILVATDVAARGLDIDALSHVINYDMPQTPQTYLHRIGRTARAGKLGSAYSFCAPEETHLLKAIQKHTERIIPVNAAHDYVPVKKPNKQNKQNKQNKPNNFKPKTQQSNHKKAKNAEYFKNAKRRKNRSHKMAY